MKTDKNECNQNNAMILTKYKNKQKEKEKAINLKWEKR